MKTWAARVMVALAAAAALNGCGRLAAGPERSAAVGAAEAGKKRVVCLLPKKKGIPYFSSCADGARASKCQWPTSLEIGRQALALLARRDDAGAVVSACAKARATAAPQESDGAADAACGSWLQDARALLQSLLPPSSPRKESHR